MTEARGLGDRLRQAREEKGLTIKQVQEETKIRRRYLDAMESGEFYIIPGGEVYQRGFLRTYARYLGIDERSLMEEWRLLRSQDASSEAEGVWGENRVLTGEGEQRKSEGHAEQKVAPRRMPRRSTARRGKHARGGGYIRWGLALLAILFVAILAGRQVYRIVGAPGDGKGPAISDNGQNHTGGKPGQENEAVSGNNTLGQGTDGSENEGQDGVDSEGEARVVISEDTGKKTTYLVWCDSLDVTLKVTDLTDRCWIRAIVDGGSPEEAELRTGQSMKWIAKEELRIRCGRPWAVAIAVNGKEFGPSGHEAPPKDMIFRVSADNMNE